MNVHVESDLFTAERALKKLNPGTGVIGFSQMDWSKIDALKAVLQKTGAAHVTIATWTAGNADISEAFEMLESRKILSLRLCVDRSFLTRQPKYVRKVIRLFGEDAVRAWENHAKFFLVKNKKAHVLYCTSANLNRNRRIENFQAFWCDELAANYATIVDRLFAAQKPGEMLRKTVTRKMGASLFDTPTTDLDLDLGDLNLGDL